MKATSLFGGVQVFQVLIQIIRSKFIAVLLGPAGMGIAGLLTNSIGLISGLTNFGLGVSAVKDVAAANETDDARRISVVVAVFRRLVWITGALGAIITLVLSSWLSQLTFGNKNYTLAFVWISVTLLFNQLASGQMVLLQGMRKLKYLANANLSGATLGLIITIPIYYFWGIDGIVPVIIITSLISMLVAFYFSSKISVEKIKVTKEITFSEGKEMLRMGVLLSISGLIATAASYILRVFINKTGGVNEVGLYSAGFTLISTYVGLVFTAMGTDYYPRLAGIANNSKKAISMINQQTEIAILILAPILTVFMIFVNWVVILLYSHKFTAINGMIHWAALGMYFRAISWSISYFFIAKGASKIYFWSELGMNIYVLLLNIVGYYFWGLPGLGISYLIGFVIFFVQVYVIAKINYQFSFEKDFIKIMYIQLMLGICCFLIAKFIKEPYSWIIGSITILISSTYSYWELNKRLDFKQLLFTFKRS